MQFDIEHKSSAAQSEKQLVDQDICSVGIVSIKFRAKLPRVRYQSIYLALPANRRQIC